MATESFGKAWVLVGKVDKNRGKGKVGRVRDGDSFQEPAVGIIRDRGKPLRYALSAICLPFLERLFVLGTVEVNRSVHGLPPVGRGHFDTGWPPPRPA